ncbi:hypothetical protein CHS0354_042074 [Potamilus streckersoni]|uniref:Uncharacterized protein n=1 Tax=Potamilus streckersoni TaxID=2493646 RepID=A0AAE0TN59_9BIVA|nr:hypothetical protein CHS0354_042074 [Potamilus streckersoni]
MASVFVVLLRAEEDEGKKEEEELEGLKKTTNSVSSKGDEKLAKIASSKSISSIVKDSCTSNDSGTEESPDESAENNENLLVKHEDRVRLFDATEDIDESMAITPVNLQDQSEEKTSSKELRFTTTSDIKRETSALMTVESTKQSDKLERKECTAFVEDEEGKDEDKHDKGDMTIFMKREPISQQICLMLKDFGVKNACVQKSFDEKFNMVTFVADSGVVEAIILKLKSLGIGSTAGTSLSVLPASIHIMEEDDEVSEDMEFVSDFSNEKESSFKKSIKSRLVVHQVVSSVRANAEFTFDYLLLIVLASLIAAMGLVENSSVALVASMLISPLMGPILASTFGQVIKNNDLRNLGIRSELAGLLICLCMGFLFGLISGGVGLHGAVWGSTDQWPTSEMQSRGMLRSLWVGVLIAIPSGAGVAISVLGGNAGSLVGVAISASLLPPAVNAGMLWAFSILAAAVPFSVNNTMKNSVSDFESFPCLPFSDNAYEPIYSCNMSHEAAILGLVSLCLTILNIICILIMGVVVLKIKEVAPHTADTETTNAFWKEDIMVAREYYATRKGATSTNLGQQFLNEWKKKEQQEAMGSSQSSPLAKEIQDPVRTLYFYKMMKDMEESPSVKRMLSELHAATPQRCPGVINANEPITSGLKEDCRRAQRKLDEQIGQQESHTDPGNLHHNHLKLLKKARSVYVEDSNHSILESPKTSDVLHDGNGAAHSSVVMNLNLDDSKLFHRQKKDKKIHFQVTKVNESSQSTGSPLLEDTKL